MVNDGGGKNIVVTIVGATAGIAFAGYIWLIMSRSFKWQAEGLQDAGR